MFFHLMLFAWAFVLDLAALSRMADEEKDLEILLLRQQLRIVERKQQRGPRIPRWQKVPLAAMVMRLKETADYSRTALADCVRLFKPDTVVGWHQSVVRLKWTFKQGRKPGRPPIDAELEQLIIKVAVDNPGLGCRKLEGELLKLGIEVSYTTIRSVLRRHGIPLGPDRSHTTWRSFLTHYKEQFLACDFFTVETLTLKTLYVLFFIEHATRRVYLAGCTPHPDGAWVVQQARQMTWELQEREAPIRYLIHDNDKKLTEAFDKIFESEDIEVIPTPYQAPNANAVAERWVRSVREECLDKLIVLNERHLRRVLTEYVDYYNARRPHQGLDQDSPLGLEPPAEGSIRHRNVLGGIIRDYYRDAA